MARTAEFNREEVLEKAMDTFWQKGYSMTSIPKLVTITKLNPGSIYAAFESKEGLFIETLEFYGKRSLATVQKFIADASSPITGIEDFFHALVNKPNDESRKGCLLVNTVLEMSSHSPRIQAKANKQLNALEKELLSALHQAQELGELSKTSNLEALARYLMVNIWGLRVMAKSGFLQDEKEAKNAVLAQVLKALHT